MMTFASIPGQERAKRTLQNALRLGSLSHAYIFSGPRGTGRMAAALALAKAIFCEKRGDEPCGACVQCRKAEHGNHSELIVLEPEGASIKIDQIRELQQRFAYRASGVPARVYIVREADRMTVQAANSLLKFLEEPLTPTVAVLITDNAQALLSTIRSRAQLVPFLPLAPAKLADLLAAEGIPANLARSAARLAAGIDAARELARAEWFAETRSVVLQLGKEALSRLPAALVAAQQKTARWTAEQWETLFDLFVLWFRDLVCFARGDSASIVYEDQRDWLSRQAFAKGVRHWLACAEQAGQARRRLRQHVQPLLVLERLLIYTNG